MMKSLLAMVVLGFLVGVWVGCEAAPRPVLPYVMDDGTGGTDLYLYDLESGTSQRLRQSPPYAEYDEYDEYDPHMDPKGSKIVFIAKRVGEPSQQPMYELTVQDLKTGIDRAYITSTYRMFSPVWSNDGQRVAYVVQRDGKLQINVRDFSTQQPATTLGFGSAPSWRIDDRAIFYSSRDTLDAPAGDLMVHDLKTGLSQSLALRGNGFTNLPRGTSIAYTSLPYSRRNQAVWLLDANSKQQRLSSPGKTYRDTDPVHINATTFVAFTRTDLATNHASIYVVERYAKDPVETQLFEAKANAYTKGNASIVR